MIAMRTMAGVVFAVLTAVTLAGTTRPAQAITADLSKKCHELSLKAFPMDKKSMTAKQRQDYYRACLVKNGKVE